jgi:MFS family permease
MTSDPTTARHDAYAVLRVRDFRLLLVGRLLSSLGGEMLTFAVAWQLWVRTHSALALGMVGLAQVVPVMVLSLLGGHFADQHNRRRIMIVGQSVYVLCALSLAFLSWTQGPILIIYAVLLVIGTVRAFNDPASSTLTPETVPPELFGNAATWSSSAWQLAAITGPALAGVWVAAVKTVTWLYVFDAGAIAA